MKPHTTPERAKAARYAFLMLVGITLAAMLALLVLSVARTATAVDRIEELAELNRRNGDRVIDCTTPKGQCFEESQRRTGAAVGTINEITVLAAYCAHEHESEPEIRTCIEDNLDR